MSKYSVNMIINQEMADLMEDRGIQQGDLEEVIQTAEAGGVKLIADDKTRFLAKKRLGNFTVYVEYAPAEDGFEVLNMYSHRVTLNEDKE